MLIGFSSRTTNGRAAIEYLTAGAVNYVTGERNGHGGTRSRAPEILRGDPQTTESLIRLVPHAHQYSSGMISFHPTDVINDGVLRSVMDEFEATAFAGLERGRDYDVLWVKHTDANVTHLHFVAPRMCIHNRHYLNICPPGSRGVFDLLRTKLNLRYGWADPEDRHRAQLVRLPNHLARLKARQGRQRGFAKVDIREMAARHVLARAREGWVKSRDDTVRVLRQAGLTVTREGNRYITITDPVSGKPVRLRGTLFDREHFSAHERPEVALSARVPNHGRLQQVEHELRQIHTARERFNRQRYARPGAELARPAPEPSRQSKEDSRHEPTGKSLTCGLEAHDRRLTDALDCVDGAIRNLDAAAGGWGKAASELEQGTFDAGRASESLECGRSQLSEAGRLLEPALEQAQAVEQQHRLDEELVSRYGAATMFQSRAQHKRLDRELEMERQ